MNIPKVSIVVPVYNVEKYIHRCIDSLLKQTLKELEIILVDDGSPDGSGKICDEYARNYTNIKVIHKANGGLGYARNSGIEIANGEFVGFIDSDDFIDPEMYEDLYLFAKENNLDTAFSAGFKRYRDGVLSFEPETNEVLIFEEKQIKERFIPEIIGSSPNHVSDVKYAMSVCRGIYSLKQIKDNKIKFLSERTYLSEDLFFNIDYLVNSYRVGITPHCYYYYCYNDNSLTRSYRPDMLIRMHVLYHAVRHRIESNSFQEDVSLNLSRLYLLMIRNILKQEVYFNREDRDKKINEILDDPILNEITQNYPYNDLPYKHRVFFLILKFRLSFAIKALHRIGKLK